MVFGAHQPSVGEAQDEESAAQRPGLGGLVSSSLPVLESKDSTGSRRSSKHRQEGGTSMDRLRRQLDSSIFPYPANNRHRRNSGHDDKDIDPADHVRAVQSALRELEQAINERYLEPLSVHGHTVFVPKGAEVVIAVVLHPKAQNKPEELKRSTIMSHINIALLNVDTSNVPLNMLRASPQFSVSPHWITVGFEVSANSTRLMFGLGRGNRKQEAAGKPHNHKAKLKPRSLLVRAKVCRSEIALVQKNINFGKMTTGETATRT